eukprot:TRINITY_DN9072_c0_g2_i1.p1 TRINITY_DN9072_c0_g2~~TRINITY_DN9072_c0_g2_i1.p1  ORF type:complete len:374 (-),score=47.26 TRINITY_DN9072_c0_g2_i1:261-1382(-)
MIILEKQTVVKIPRESFLNSLFSYLMIDSLTVAPEVLRQSMGRKDCLFIINPQGGSGKAKRQWEKVRAQVRSTLKDKFNVVEKYTQAQGDATYFSREAVLSGIDCVVAVGGDGTTNEVANGFFESGKPLWNSDSSCPTKLAVVPLGTGSDLMRSLGLDRNIQSAIERIKNGDTRFLDVGILRASNDEGKPEHRAFLNVASCGMGALTCTHAKKYSQLPGAVAYYLAVLTGLLLYRGQRINIQVSNKNQVIGNVHMKNATLIALSNGQYFGGGMKVAPGAKMSDGQLDLAAFDDYSFFKFVRVGHHLRNGTYQNNEGKILFDGISRRIGTRIDIQAEDNTVNQKEQLMFEVDGEIWGRLPASVEIIPHAIEVVI